MPQRLEVSKCCLKNDTNRLSWSRVDTNVQFVRSSVKQRSIKQDMAIFDLIIYRYLWVRLTYTFFCLLLNLSKFGRKGYFDVMK